MSPGPIAATCKQRFRFFKCVVLGTKHPFLLMNCERMHALRSVEEGSAMRLIKKPASAEKKKAKQSLTREVSVSFGNIYRFLRQSFRRELTNSLTLVEEWIVRFTVIDARITYRYDGVVATGTSVTNVLPTVTCNLFTCLAGARKL